MSFAGYTIQEWTGTAILVVTLATLVYAIMWFFGD